MNAIVALCHFCELHGPSVLFCTQAFHDSDDPQKVLQDQEEQMRRIFRRMGQQFSTNIHDNGIKSSKRCYGKPTMFQRSSSVSSSSGCGSTADSSPASVAKNYKGASSSDTCCDACRSIPIGQSGFVSNDHDARVSYISTQNPFHPEIFSIVRQACVRSLSCEVCPGREGPIFFGDEDRGHVLSHTFFLKDSQARGFQRWYSIIVVMMDKIFLLNSWPFLVKHLRTVIDELQEKATKLYQVEQAECPQRVVRLNSVTNMTPGNFRRQRGSSKMMRSLDELTSDKDVFAGLHLWFTWILKAGGNRLTEKLLEGSPTEDTVIDLEKQEETEEGFMLISTKKVPKENYEDASLADLRVVTPAVVSIANPDNDDILNDDDDEQSNNLPPRVRTIRDLWRLLGQSMFHDLAYHVVVGNQIIVLCDDKQLIVDIISSLEILLPRGCVNAVMYSPQYIDSWKCNFLGMPLNGFLPKHVRNSDLHVVVEATPSQEDVELADQDLRSNYEITVRSPLVIPERGPAVLHRMEKVIASKEFSERVLVVYFMTLKEEWMNKVKVLFKFSRAGSRTVEDTLKLLQVLGAQERDKQVLKFWMTGLSTQYKTHILSATMSQCHGNEGAVS